MSEIRLVHSKKSGLYAIIGDKDEITAIWDLLKTISAWEEDED